MAVELRTEHSANYRRHQPDWLGLRTGHTVLSQQWHGSQSLLVYKQQQQLRPLKIQPQSHLCLPAPDTTGYHRMDRQSMAVSHLTASHSADPLWCDCARGALPGKQIWRAVSAIQTQGTPLDVSTTHAFPYIESGFKRVPGCSGADCTSIMCT